jgi:hypothetical protein
VARSPGHICAAWPVARAVGVTLAVSGRDPLTARRLGAAPRSVRGSSRPRGGHALRLPFIAPPAGPGSVRGSSRPAAARRRSVALPSGPRSGRAPNATAPAIPTDGRNRPCKDANCSRATAIAGTFPHPYTPSQTRSTSGFALNGPRPAQPSDRKSGQMCCKVGRSGVLCRHLDRAVVAGLLPLRHRGPQELPPHGHGSRRKSWPSAGNSTTRSTQRSD